MQCYMRARAIDAIGDSWLLTFTYMHSTHQVAVDLDINIIPEFSSFLIILSFKIATSLAVACMPIVVAVRKIHDVN